MKRKMLKINMKITIMFSYLCILIITCLSNNSCVGIDKPDPEQETALCKKNMRWSEGKANQWYNSQPWPVGINYVTSSAVNQIEMWQEDTFDPQTIDKELGWAEDLGFNTVRIFLHDLLWEADSLGYAKRIYTVLDICQKYEMRALVTFYTNGGKGIEPHLGKQSEYKPGVHNGGWVQSPGVSVVNDPSKWGHLERYIKGIINEFKDDNRILMWCLYNEPENDGLGANSMPLLRKTFEWARSVNPSQPLTSPIMLMPCETRTRLDIVSFLGENCDVITFHSYEDEKYVEKFIKLLKSFNRPVICTEYMGRPRSRFDNILPIFKKENVGAISLGLVAGKCGFYNRWDGQEGDPEPEIWYHDIFRNDGTPYNEQEIELIKKLTGQSR